MRAWAVDLRSSASLSADRLTRQWSEQPCCRLGVGVLAACACSCRRVVVPLASDGSSSHSWGGVRRQRQRQTHGERERVCVIIFSIVRLSCYQDVIYHVCIHVEKHDCCSLATSVILAPRRWREKKKVDLLFDRNHFFFGFFAIFCCCSLDRTGLELYRSPTEDNAGVCLYIYTYSF